MPAAYQPAETLLLLFDGRQPREKSSLERECILCIGFRIYVTQQLKIFAVLLLSLTPLQQSKKNHGHTASFNHS